MPRTLLPGFKSCALLSLLTVAFLAAPAHASDADLVIPRLNGVTYFGGIGGGTLLLAGLVIGVLGLIVRHGRLQRSYASCRCTSRCSKSPS